MTADMPDEIYVSTYETVADCVALEYWPNDRWPAVFKQNRDRSTKYLRSTPHLEAARVGWLSMNTAPRNEKLFLCRKKSKPHVTFEAVIFRESESWEMPSEYEVFQDMTADQPIDGDWTDYEWTHIPQPPQVDGGE